MAKPPSWRWLLTAAPLLLHSLADASRGRHIALRPALAAACTPHGGCEKQEKHFWHALRGCQGYASLPPRAEAEEEDKLCGKNVGREQIDGENVEREQEGGLDKERLNVEREQEVVVEDGLDGARFLGANVRREQERVVEMDWLKLTDRELQVQCRVETLRSSGPGGQHRNKTESAVRLLHLPTGLVAFAAEDRSQHKNRTMAFKRLREVIALEVRRPVELEGYRAPPELMRILPKASKKREGGQRIGPNHDDFVQGVQPLLDLLGATKGSISECAAILGLSTGALSRLLVSDRVLWKGVNNLRASYNLKPIRGD